ncbi:MAG: hypothetical protein Q8K98_02890, partial [Bacteroidota bacterium]|nr:hypothetical protein [Bacteroidota bacterium]
PSTVISWHLPAGQAGLPVSSYVKLKVYDVLGREVATLVNEFKRAGKYHIEFRSSDFGLSSGIYFYRLVVSSNEPLQTKSYTETKKMILIR